VRIEWICKRYYSGRDLIREHFGRCFHLAAALQEAGREVHMIALDWKTRRREKADTSWRLESIPWPLMREQEATAPDLRIAGGHAICLQAALRRSRRDGVPLFLDAYDYYPGYGPGPEKYWNRWWRRRFANLDGAVAASPALQDWLRTGVTNTILIENGTDPARFREAWPIRTFPFQPAIFYAGSDRPGLGLAELIEATAQLRPEFPKIGVVVAGPRTGAVPESPVWEHLGNRPPAEMPGLFQSADILAIPYQPDRQVRYASSAKLPEYLASERPIVATATADNPRFLPEDYPGLVREPGSTALAAALRRQIKARFPVPFPEELEWTKLGSKLSDWLEQCALKKGWLP